MSGKVAIALFVLIILGPIMYSQYLQNRQLDSISSGVSQLQLEHINQVQRMVTPEASVSAEEPEASPTATPTRVPVRRTATPTPTPSE